MPGMKWKHFPVTPATQHGWYQSILSLFPGQKPQSKTGGEEEEEKEVETDEEEEEEVEEVKEKEELKGTRKR